MQNKNKKVYIFDLEQFSNLHTGVFWDRDSEEKRVFVIHHSQNDIVDYIEFLETEVAGLIGFNNINYDYPIIHYILTEIRLMKDSFDNPNHINSLLKIKSDWLIDKNNKFTAIKYWEVLIPQLDSFKIHHFDNKAKTTRLKNLEFVLRLDNVEDLDLDFNLSVNTEDISRVLHYNSNDVYATKKVYELTIPEIELRKKIRSKFGLECMNFNDAKIGADLFLKIYSELTNREPREIRHLRTYRSNINLNEVILPYINFKTKHFQSVLRQFKKTVVSGTKGDFDVKINYKGVEYKWALGGLHACVEAGIYEEDEEYVIIDIDVAGYYSSVAISNGFYPEHLGKRFVDAYKIVLNEKNKAARLIKEGKNIEDNKQMKSTFKLSSNAIFGKSNDIFSFLFDSFYTLSTTVNGQLLITMLVERILFSLQGVQLLQINTDGFTLKLKRSEEQQMMKICKKWEVFTKLDLEFANYKKMVIRDVNSYLCVYNKPEEELKPQFPKSNWYDNFYSKHKVKGIFQVVLEQNGKIALNKNWSQRIVAKALYNYYIYNIPIKKTIRECKDIYDFCKMYKAASGFVPIYTNSDGSITTLTSTTRYFISSDGVALFKLNKEDKRRIAVESKQRVTIFNKFEKKPFHEYKVNYLYYIKECNKIINTIENKGQIKLKL